MTDMVTNEKPSQYKIELLLPWHAAGTLNSRDPGREGAGARQGTGVASY
jgi:hypothetical protein